MGYSLRHGDHIIKLFTVLQPALWSTCTFFI